MRTAAVVVAAVCAAGAIAAAPPAAQATGGSEAVIPSVLRAAPRADRVIFAGDSGFLHQREGDGALWTPYADPDASTKMDWITGNTNLYGNNGAWGDVVASPAKLGDTTTVTFHDTSDGTEWKVVLPAGQTYAASFGSTVLSVTYSNGAVVSWHLLDLVDGTVRDRPVTGFPAGATLRPSPSYANGQGILTTYTVDGATHTAWVGLAGADAATVTEDQRQSGARSGLIGDRFTVWHTDGAVTVFDTADFTKPLRTFSVPYEKNARLLGFAGDALLVARYDVPADGTMPRANDRVHRIVALPADGGGAERTLLTQASAEVDVARDGSMVVVAGSDPEAASIQRITVVDGAPQVRMLTTIPAVRSQSVLAPLANGRLLTYDSLTGTAGSFNRRTVSAGSDLDYSAAVKQDGGGARWDGCSTGVCPQAQATGDGRLVVGDRYAADSAPVLVSADGATSSRLGTTLHQPGIAAASGRFALVDGQTGDGTKSYAEVIDLDKNAPLRTLPIGDYALWGRTLWQRDAAKTTYVPMDVVTGTKGTAVEVGSECKNPYGVRAVGHWLYWGCSSGSAKAALTDLATGRTTALSRAAWVLGDGWLASVVDDAVVVDDVTSGVPTESTRFTPKKIADYYWHGDPYGGPLAWVDARDDIHITRTGTATSRLTRIDADVPASAAIDRGAASWKPRWWLSKPAASWTLTLKNKATGVTVRTLTGGETRGAVTAAWNGTSDAGTLVADASYTWTLNAEPADGQGAALTTTGTVAISGARTAQHDMVGRDRIGDLLTMNTSGDFTYQHGTGEGTFAGKTSASGWPTGTVAVPFGDADNDGANETLVRTTGGELRSYRTGGGALEPTTPYTKIGAGWNGYDSLTSPGDLTGDGLPDLLARNVSTGDLYVYPGQSNGTLAPRTKIGSGWSGYTIAGVGDLTGDGIGDVVARRKDGTVFRYDGDGKGMFKAARATVGTGWTMYDSLVGVGDITGDGKNDLVARDTSGNLYRYDGRSDGTFAARVKIATGWQGYKGLF
ncbi:FG-GAP-like repeat-containing protein [Streptomyces sp. NPDC050095]|uniref:FG-GAP-like repeat-containing protein n=1 Tax=unclassified Streptomyces TaxID=2593676 RepID=UPI00342C5E3D